MTEMGQTALFWENISSGRTLSAQVQTSYSSGRQTRHQFIIIAINGFVGWKKKTHLSFLYVGKDKGSNGNML